MTFRFRPLRELHVTSPFGDRDLDDDGTNESHKGVDYRAPVGTPTFAMGDSIVERADDVDDSANGKHVVLIDDTDGRLVYLHLSRVDVVGGQRVHAGQRIGLTGKSGAAQGPHLHLQWQPNGAGRAVDDVDPVAQLLPAPPQSESADDDGSSALFWFLALVAGGFGVRALMKKRRAT